MRVNILLSDDLQFYVADDPSLLDEAIAFERRQIGYQQQRVAMFPDDSTEKVRLARAFQKLSDYLKAQQDYAQALQCNEEALKIWEELGRARAHFLGRLKRATLLQFLNRADETLYELNQLLKELSDTTAMYEDFIYEARALYYFRQGKSHLARADLQHVLALRTTRGHKDHIRETREMLTRVGG